jgi:hypothetical protein
VAIYGEQAECESLLSDKVNDSTPTAWHRANRTDKLRRGARDANILGLVPLQDAFELQRRLPGRHLINAQGTSSQPSQYEMDCRLNCISLDAVLWAPPVTSNRMPVT